MELLKAWNKINLYLVAVKELQKQLRKEKKTETYFAVSL